MDTTDAKESCIFKNRCYIYKLEEGKWKSVVDSSCKIEVELLVHDLERKARLVIVDPNSRKPLLNHFIHPTSELCPTESAKLAENKSFTWTAMDYANETEFESDFAIKFSSRAVAELFKLKYDSARSINAEFLSILVDETNGYAQTAVAHHGSQERIARHKDAAPKVDDKLNLVQMKAPLKGIATNIENLEVTNRQLEESLHLALKTSEKLSLDNERLNRELSTTQSLVESTTSGFERAEKSRIESAISVLNAKNDQIETLKANNEALEEQVGLLTSELEERKNSKRLFQKELEQQAQERDEALAQLIQSKDKLIAVQGDQEALREPLRSHQQTIANLRNEICTLDLQLIDVRKNFAQSETSRIEQEAESLEWRFKFQEVKDINSELVLQVERSRVELNSSLEHFALQKQHFEQERQAKANESTRLLLEKNFFSHQLQSTEQDRDAAVVTSQRLREEKEDCSQRLVKAMHTHSSQATELLALKHEIEVAKIKSKEPQLAETIRRIEAKLNKKKAAVTTLQNEKAELQKQLTGVQRELSVCKDELLTSENEKYHMQAHLHEMHKKIGNLAAKEMEELQIENSSKAIEEVQQLEALQKLDVIVQSLLREEADKQEKHVMFEELGFVAVDETAEGVADHERLEVLQRELAEARQEHALAVQRQEQASRQEYDLKQEQEHGRLEYECTELKFRLDELQGILDEKQAENSRLVAIASRMSAIQRSEKGKYDATIQKLMEQLELSKKLVVELKNQERLTLQAVRETEEELLSSQRELATTKDLLENVRLQAEGGMLDALSRIKQIVARQHFLNDEIEDVRAKGFSHTYDLECQLRSAEEDLTKAKQAIAAQQQEMRNLQLVHNHSQEQEVGLLKDQLALAEYRRSTALHEYQARVHLKPDNSDDHFENSVKRNNKNQLRSIQSLFANWHTPRVGGQSPCTALRSTASATGFPIPLALDGLVWPR